MYINTTHEYSAEYVDDSWLHVHATPGMYSIYLTPVQLAQLRACILSGLERSKDCESTLHLLDGENETKVFLEGPDKSEGYEDHFNLHFQTGSAVIIMGFARSELKDFIQYLEQE